MSETWHAPPSEPADREGPEATEPTRPLLDVPPGKPKIVGLFGLAGAGTEFLLEQLKKEIGEDDFAFYDGSNALAVLCPGGLMAYNELDFAGRRRYRDMTIGAFEKECMRKDVMGVVVRHLALWNEYHDCFSSMPIVEIKAHTHILYLELPLASYSKHWKTIFPYGQAEEESVRQWESWQQSEISYLRRLCRKKEITFTVLTPHLSELPKVSSLLRDFRVLTEEQNRAFAEGQLLEIMKLPFADSVETVLLFDADGTLTPQDSEELLWDHIPGHLLPPGVEYPPSKETFSQFRSTYNDYLQAALLHEEMWDDPSYKAVCQKVADSIQLYPDMWALLRRAVETPHVLPIILTGGPRKVWKQVMRNIGVFDVVGVIGGGRHTDRALMTPDVKGWLVTVLQEQCHADVWAFGSGLVDLIMLMKADHSVVITDQETWVTREDVPVWQESLQQACPDGYEVILSIHSPVYLQYPIYEMRQFGRNVAEKIFARRIQISYLTRDRPSEILSSFVSEDSSTYLVWKTTQHETGSFLADKFLKRIIGKRDSLTDDDPLFSGNVTILAATPGSMPMASGVHREFVGTQFLTPEALTTPSRQRNRILKATRVLVLVKSVIITEDFLMGLLHKHGAWIDSLMKIVIVAGTIFAPVLANTLLARIFGQIPHASFVTLHCADVLDCPEDAPEVERV